MCKSVTTKLRKIKNIILIYQKRSASVRKSIATKPHMDNDNIYQKRSASVHKSINMKPCMNKYQLFIYQKRSTSVHKSINTKPCKIKNILSEEECKCVQVRKYKAMHDKSINQSINHLFIRRRSTSVCKSVNTKPRKIKKGNNNIKLSEEVCKCVQVHTNQATHIKIFIRRGVQVCASL